MRATHTAAPRRARPVAVDRTSVADGLQRVDVFGLRFVDAPDEAHVTRQLLGSLGSDDGAETSLPVVVTPNVHHLVSLDRQPPGAEHELCRRARFVLPDGQPVVLAGRLLGRGITARLAGSTLFGHLWPELCREAIPTLLISPSELVAERLLADHPTAWAYTPPFFDADDDAVLDHLVDICLPLAQDGAAEVVVVGLGNPKQERLVARLLDRWPETGTPRPLFLCLGASLEFEAGLRRRAPRWMQRVGLEWFFRFAQEPRRLFRRYFVEDVRFVGIVWREWRRLAT